MSLTDLTPQVRKAAALLRAGRAVQARRLLPGERVCPLPPALESRLCSAR